MYQGMGGDTSMIAIDTENASKREVEVSLDFLNMSSVLDIAQILEEMG